MSPAVGLAAVGASDQAFGGRPVMLMLAVAGLSLIPFLLLLMTSFVKIAVVLSILKGALGTPQVPPNQVVTGLALILTLFVMAPTGERMYRAAGPVLGRGAGADLVSAQSAGALVAAPPSPLKP